MDKATELSILRTLGRAHRIAGDRFSIGPARSDGDTFTILDANQMKQVAVLLDGQNHWPEPYRSVQEARADAAIVVTQRADGFMGAVSTD